MDDKSGVAGKSLTRGTCGPVGVMLLVEGRALMSMTKAIQTLEVIEDKVSINPGFV